MDITCPHCRQTLEGETVNPGDSVVCPACNREFSVPKLVAVGNAPSGISNMKPSTFKAERKKKWSPVKRARIVAFLLCILLCIGAIGAGAAGHASRVHQTMASVFTHRYLFRFLESGLTEEEYEIIQDFKRFFQDGAAVKPNWFGCLFEGIFLSDSSIKAKYFDRYDELARDAWSYAMIGRGNNQW